MSVNANQAIAMIAVGGAALGLLASTAIKTSPNGPPDPPWRVAARTAASQPAAYSIADSGPIDLSPRLPWIGTGSNGSVAPMPEDYYRQRLTPVRAGTETAVRDPASRPARAELASHATRDPADEDQDRAYADEPSRPDLSRSYDRYGDEPADDDDEDAQLGG